MALNNPSDVPPVKLVCWRGLPDDAEEWSKDHDAEEWSKDHDAEEWSKDHDAEVWSKDHDAARMQEWRRNVDSGVRAIT